MRSLQFAALPSWLAGRARPNPLAAGLIGGASTSLLTAQLLTLRNRLAVAHCPEAVVASEPGADLPLALPLPPPVQFGSVTLTAAQWLLLAVVSIALAVASWWLARYIGRVVDAKQEAENKVCWVPYATFTAMTEMAKHRDEETGLHLVRCSLYARKLAEALQASGYAEASSIQHEDIDAIAAAVPLHDIGKVGIPDSILHKPGRLDSEEREVMNRHTNLGAEIIERMALALPEKDDSMLKIAHDVAIAHHENWDGSGYPYGLAGREIPLIARIMSVIDVYDAMASKRVYKEAIPHEQVLEEMARQRGTKFDPDLFDLMITIQDHFRKIFEDNKDEPELASPEAWFTDGPQAGALRQAF